MATQNIGIDQPMGPADARQVIDYENGHGFMPEYSLDQSGQGCQIHMQDKVIAGKEHHVETFPHKGGQNQALHPDEYDVEYTDEQGNVLTTNQQVYDHASTLVKEILDEVASLEGLYGKDVIDYDQYKELPSAEKDKYLTYLKGVHSPDEYTLNGSVDESYKEAGKLVEELLTNVNPAQGTAKHKLLKAVQQFQNQELLPQTDDKIVEFILEQPLDGKNPHDFDALRANMNPSSCLFELPPEELKANLAKASLGYQVDGGKIPAPFLKCLLLSFLYYAGNVNVDAMDIDLINRFVAEFELLYSHGQNKLTDIELPPEALQNPPSAPFNNMEYHNAVKDLKTNDIEQSTFDSFFTVSTSQLMIEIIAVVLFVIAQRIDF